MKMFRKRVYLLLAFIIALYGFSYLVARLNDGLVDKISEDAYGNRWYNVTARSSSKAGHFTDFFYAPLRFVEVRYLNLVDPVYPRPVLATPKDDPRPEPKKIEWSEAVDLIKSGQVSSVLQTHSLHVGLGLTNGDWVSTREPSIDLVFSIIDQYAPNASQIQKGTE